MFQHKNINLEAILYYKNNFKRTVQVITYIQSMAVYIKL